MQIVVLRKEVDKVFLLITARWSDTERGLWYLKPIDGSCSLLHLGISRLT